MYYPDDLIEEIRSRNDIVDVISGYVHLQKKGSSYFGLCPFHSEKTPSFSVSRTKQMYYCFGCGAGGNVFTFLMNYENDTFPEAVKRLADRVGIALPEVELSEEDKRKMNLKSLLLEINKEAAKYFYYQLRSKPGENGMRYFKKRELSDETMQKFGLGYSNKFSDDLVRYLKSKGYHDDAILKAGLAVGDERRGIHDKFWNRVMFPIQDQNHRVIGFGGRVMGEGEPKYLNSPETLIFDKSRNLYGLNYARSSRKNHMLLCEGYMDVISMHQAGFTEAVASLGTAFTPGQANLLRRFTDTVILAYDSDGAGTKAALRAIGILKEAGLTGRVLSLSPYKDPDEFIKNLGKEEFEKRIQNAENSFFFEIRILERNYKMDDPDSKTRFFKELAKRLTGFTEEIERENYIQAFAGKYFISVESLRNMVNTIGEQKGLAAPARPLKSGIKSKATAEDKAKRQQGLLLTWLVEKPELYQKLKKYLDLSDFTDDLYRKVAKQLFSGFEKGVCEPASIISLFENEEEQHEVARIFHTTLPKMETKTEREKAVHDIVIGVKENSLEYYTMQTGSDLGSIQKVLDARKKLEELNKIHITLDE